MDISRPSEPSQELLNAFNRWLHGDENLATASSRHWNSPTRPCGVEIICVDGTRVFVPENTIAVPGGDGERVAYRTVTLPNGEWYNFFLPVV